MARLESGYLAVAVILSFLCISQARNFDVERILYKHAYVVQIPARKTSNLVKPIINLVERYEHPEKPKLYFLTDNLRPGVNVTFILPRTMRTEILQYLEDNLVEYRIKHTDLQRLITEDRQANTDNRRRWTERKEKGPYEVPQYFMSPGEIDVWLHDLVKAHKDLITLHNLVHTHEQRRLLYVKIPNTNTSRSDHEVINVFINAGLDPRTWISTSSSLYLILQILSDETLRDGISWTIVPLSNPDGYFYNQKEDRMWAKNRMSYGGCFGADLTRNWAKQFAFLGERYDRCNKWFRGVGAFCEVETKALSDAILGDPDLDVYVNIEATPGAWLQPWAGRAHTKTEDFEDLIDVSVAVTSAINAPDDVRMVNGTPPELRRQSNGAPMDWVKEYTPIKYAYTMDLVHASDDLPISYIQPASEINRNGDWVTTAMKAMTSSIRQFRETGEWQHVTLGGKPKGYEPPATKFYDKEARGDETVIHTHDGVEL